MVLDWAVKESFTKKVIFELRLKDLERNDMNLLGEQCSEQRKQAVPTVI